MTGCVLLENLTFVMECLVILFTYYEIMISQTEVT